MLGLLSLIIETNELDNTWKTKFFFLKVDLFQIADNITRLMLKYAEEYNTVNWISR